jgi:hypothetical protein
MEEKAQGQQYHTPWEEDVVIKFLLQMSDIGQPIRMKFVPSIVVIATRKRQTTQAAREELGEGSADFDKHRPLFA